MAGGSGRGILTRRLRVGAGIVLVLVFALHAPCQQALKLAAAGFTMDPVVVAEKRYKRVMQTLPMQGVYGYRASGPLKIGKNFELEGLSGPIGQYVIAQYILAPRVLDLGPTRPVVIRDDLDPPRVMPREDR
jgi:hypothetical protein